MGALDIASALAIPGGRLIACDTHAMIFTSPAFIVFFAVVFPLYWMARNRGVQNGLLLVASYVFYGWVHPWFCILLASSTVVDYLCGLAMGEGAPEGAPAGTVRPTAKRRLWLTVSLAFNLSVLGTFKYFDFFAQSFSSATRSFGLELGWTELNLFLPVGLSFYTFQSLSYTIDIYRGHLRPRRSFLDFAVFVSFFPQLVAGPIERASRFLPQVESRRTWEWGAVFPALQLICGGYLKKIVVADNVGPYVDEVFALQSPTLLMLAVGAFGFAVQIYADFSAYTDIARGLARLIGFDLVLNFRSPYLAISPSDFWRRWHISFSSWIRDYLYIPLGGSKHGGPLRFFWTLLASLGLSGLWHGAAWHFVLWGVYHAAVVFAYHQLGMGGRWRPKGAIKTLVAWGIMFAVTLVGWLIFRTDDMGWLVDAVQRFKVGISVDNRSAALYLMGLMVLYSLPLWILGAVERLPERWVAVRSGFMAAAVVGMLVFGRSEPADFIYFQF